jgi:hypothetical protein
MPKKKYNKSYNSRRKILIEDEIPEIETPQIIAKPK